MISFLPSFYFFVNCFFCPAFAHFVDDVQLNVEVKQKQMEFIVSMHPRLMEELLSKLSEGAGVTPKSSEKNHLLFKASLGRIAQHHQADCHWQGNPSVKNFNAERLVVKNTLVCKKTPSQLEMDFAFLKELTLMKYAHLMGKVRSGNNKMTSFSATPSHSFVKIPLGIR